MVVDAACEYSMYASDITRTVPVNGHFTARQREIYNIVLGAQQAAIDAFVAGKSKINDRDRKDPNSLDNAAYNYINTHGKDLHGQPLGQYWLHGLGHMVGIDVHDPARLSGGAQAGDGVYHRARRLHSRREAGRAHRVRLSGGRGWQARLIWTPRCPTPPRKLKPRCRQSETKPWTRATKWNPAQLETLARAFGEQLLACLDECARGRKGLFSEYVGGDEKTAAGLRRRGCASWRWRLQAILPSRKSATRSCDEFLDLCTIHGESNPGERKLARAFLERIERGEVGTPTEEEESHGDSARISGAGGGLCRRWPLLVIAMTALLTRLTPELGGDRGQARRPGYIFVNLGYSFLAAAAGGYVTAWVAAANPLIHVLALGIIVLALAALSALQSRGKQPIWYQLALVAHFAAGRAGGRAGAAAGVGNFVNCPLV